MDKKSELDLKKAKLDEMRRRRVNNMRTSEKIFKHIAILNDFNKKN